MKRKRTSKTIPAKGRLRDMADRLWSRAIMRKWDGRCAVCSKRATDAHHLVPRANYATRYEISNGIALCAWDHLWNPKTAPHMNAAGWVLWLSAKHQATADFYILNANREFTGTTNVAFFLDAIHSLQGWVPEPEFVAIVGKKFALHLTVNP